MLDLICNLDCAVANHGVEYPELLTQLFHGRFCFLFRLAVNDHLEHLGRPDRLDARVAALDHEVAVDGLAFRVIDVGLVFDYHLQYVLWHGFPQARCYLNRLGKAEALTINCSKAYALEKDCPVWGQANGYEYEYLISK